METVTLETLDGFAQRILARLPNGKASATLVTLQGELGAGKTTLAQAIARELGVVETVQSPTYVLMRSYAIDFKSFKKLVHIDAYRLEAPGEFSALRPEEFLNDPAALVLVEWPERLEGALPKPDLTVRLSSEGAKEGERYIEVI